MRVFNAWLAAVALCLTAHPADAAALSLHAAHLTPALSLLSWSGFASPSLLSLSLNSLSGPRPQLPLSAASSTHLIVTDLGAQSAEPRTFALCASHSHSRDKGAREDGSPSSAPLCAHATLPAASVASSPSLIEGARVWDLSGARLHAEVSRSPADASAHRVSWSVASVAHDPAAPPLLYSLFAQWSAPTVSLSDLRTNGSASQPTLRSHSIRMCSKQTHSNDSRTSLSPEQGPTLHCDIDQHRLPTGVEITLQFITECDYQTIEEGGGRLPRCLSAVSPSVVVTLLPLLSPSPLLPAVVLASGAPFHVKANDSAVVSAALCQFFSNTSGSEQWTYAMGWCQTGVSYCFWYGLTCNDDADIVAIRLGDNKLGMPVAASTLVIDPLLLVLPKLQFLNLSNNEMMSLRSLNLSAQAELTTLDLSSAALTNGQFLPVSLTLPTNCSLLHVNLKDSCYVFPLIERCPDLQHLLVARNPCASMDFALIQSLPSLVEFDAAYMGALSSDDSLTILANLSESNPVLQLLDISSTSLQFHPPIGALDNWPHVRSATLRTLAFGANSQIFTPWSGPADQQWLVDLPALTTLNITGMPSAFVYTNVFSTANPGLQNVWMASTAVVVVSQFEPLFHLSGLQSLIMDNTNMYSILPFNISAIWPQLTLLSIRGCNLGGPVPSFRGLPFLTTLLLSQNTLNGDLPPDFVVDSPAVTVIDLSQNQLTGTLPSLANQWSLLTFSCDSNVFTALPVPWPYLPVLTMLTCSNNQLAGSLDSNFWSLLPSVQKIDLSSNLLSGVIPSPALPYDMELFSVGNNQFNSPLPQNIIAWTLDLSYNYLYGSLRLVDPSVPGPFPLNTLNLESTGGLECPIELSQFGQLNTLNIAGAGFSGCAWLNSSLVALPLSPTSQLQILDISRNSWLPMIFPLPQGMVRIVRANYANILQFTTSSAVGYSLSSLSLDGNQLNNAMFGIRALIHADGSMLRSFSCASCGLAFDIQELFALMTQNLVLESLDLSSNNLIGRLPPTLFSIAAESSVLPLTIRVLDLSNNAGLGGPLPVGDSSYSNLQEIDVSGTAVSGAIPPTWNSFSALQRLTVQATETQCLLEITPLQQLQCKLGSWIQPSATSTAYVSTVDSTAQAHCPTMSIAGSNTSTIAMDPTYHARTLCVCDSGSFGKNGQCYSCPEGCTCSGAVIQNCFPVLNRGVLQMGLTRPYVAAPTSQSIQQFTLVVMLPCPRTVTGQSLCNPDGIEWTRFYNVTQTYSQSVSTVRPAKQTELSDPANDDDHLSGWCYPGHTGRLCAQCSRGYFSSGRWCLRCLGEGVHVVILIANLLVIVALIAYLFFKSPKPLTAVKALAEYRARMRADGPAAPGPRALLAMPPAADRSYLAVSDLVDAADADAAEPVSEAANPLKLLIFHSQQLSLLLQTTASMPNVIAGLMSAVSSGSNGFSLSSLVAMECLNTAWSMQHRCWLAIVAPLIIAAVAGLTFLADRRASSATLNRSGRLQFSMGGATDRQQALLADGAAAVDVSSAVVPTESSFLVPRIYGVCVSLLYLLVFPCAQTALSALTCTDTRERTQLDSRVYLNLFPAQQCDDEWSRTVLPPALLGALFWLIVFPLCSTLMLRRLQAQLQSASTDSSASALSAWPICSDLLSPYSPRFWFWEQILLMRRLMLVAAVTIIPASSLYLPLALFALIQLCALLQHWTHPFAHSLLNAGELVSLYLLLINYISALILSTGLVEGGFRQTADLWAVLLFLLNFAFLSALVIGLFGFIRKWTVTKLAHLRGQRESSQSSSVRL